MTINELNHCTKEWIVNEIKNGGKFVVFPYCISIIFMSFQRTSDVYFLRNGEMAIKHGWIYMLISCLLGWWGIPWGLIFTIKSICYSFSGKDCTADVVGHDQYLYYMIYQQPWDEALSHSTS